MKKTLPALALLLACHDDPSWTLSDDAEAIVAPRPADAAPPPPGFSLEVNNLFAGDYAELHVTGAPPGALLRLAWGRALGDGPCPRVFDGLCLSVASPVRVATFGSLADADGEAWIVFRMPGGRVEPVAFQVAAMGASVALSNPVQRLVGPAGGDDPTGDHDADGYTQATDCADYDASVHPGADDAVGDGIDQDCDHADGVDDDADGYASLASGGTDCGDDDAGVWPGATEVCNGLDDDCDGDTDPDTAEGVSTFYLDGDGDDHGTTAGSVIACAAPDGYGTYSDDCNDSNSAIHPGHAETCNNNVDDDCDGQVDEGCGPIVTTFTTVGTTTWTVPAGITTVQALVVGGGGGGGTGRGGGGGGAGGLVTSASYAVTPGASISVTVGAGGVGGTNASGSTSGQPSAFGTLVASGGGAGGNFTGGGTLTGTAGGSGGGGAGGASYAPGAGTSGQGYGGGGGSSGAGGCYFGGGGGGGNAAGTGALSGCAGGAGNGGAGKAVSITGVAVYYAGGGAGSPSSIDAGGVGGGGGGGGSLVNGNSNGIPITGESGTANTGGGGGGGGYSYSSAAGYGYHPGGAGGAGVVILRYCTDCTLPAL